MIKRYSTPEMLKIWSEENKIDKMWKIEVYVCEAWANHDKIPVSALKKIQQKIVLNPERIREIESVTHHDIVAFVTAAAEKIGSAAQYLHKGLTSSDVVDTTFSLQLVETAEILLVDLHKLAATLKKLAKKYKYLPMIGRTHGIHAEPITLGFKFAGWYSETLRDIERMKKAKEVVRYGKISGAVGTYAQLEPEIESYVCKKLGLNPEPISTQIIPRDRYAEYLSIVAIVAASLEKFALEIRHLQRTEVRELEEYFSPGQKGSSAMPHKRNPIICERICGLSRVLRSNLIAALENVALWHERDISHSSVERIIFPDSTTLLDYMLHKMNDLLQNLIVYPAQMERNMNLTRGLLYSQRVLLALMEKGLGRIPAYNLVQHNSMKVWDGENNFYDLIIKDEEILSYLNKQEIDKCFDLKYYSRYMDKIFKRLGI